MGHLNHRRKGEGDVFSFRAAPVEVSEAPDVLRVNFVPKPGGAGVLEPDGVLAPEVGQEKNEAGRRSSCVSKDAPT